MGHSLVVLLSAVSPPFLGDAVKRFELRNTAGLAIDPAENINLRGIRKGFANCIRNHFEQRMAAKSW